MIYTDAVQNSAAHSAAISENATVIKSHTTSK